MEVQEGERKADKRMGDWKDRKEKRGSGIVARFKAEGEFVLLIVRGKGGGGEETPFTCPRGRETGA